MKPIDRVAMSFVAFGFLFHTYIHVAKAEWFSVGFWLWAVSPYLVALIILLRFRNAHATIGALVFPIVVDMAMYHSVFVSPRGSTAGLGMLFAPLWNLVLFVPLGAFAGRWVGKQDGDNVL